MSRSHQMTAQDIIIQMAKMHAAGTITPEEIGKGFSRALAMADGRPLRGKPPRWLRNKLPQY